MSKIKTCGDLVFKCNIVFFIILIPVFLFSQPFPKYTVNVCTNESNGYYFLAPFKLVNKTPTMCYQMILNSKGEMVYFKKFNNQKPINDFKVQPNRQISYFYNDKFFIMDSIFSIIDSVYCSNGMLTDGHDLNITEKGNYILIGIKEIKTDLSKYKIFKNNSCYGSKNAKVRYGVILELNKNKEPVFVWQSNKTYKIEDIDPYYLTDTTSVNIPHINSVELDHENNFIISCRNYNEISKIRRKDTLVEWRLGGKKNQFVFKNDTIMFKAQHSAKRLLNGNVTLFDNGFNSEKHPSAGKEYLIDEKELTANLMWSYTNNPTSSSTAIGNLLRLKNGNTLINYGISTNCNVMFNVINKNGSKIFELEFLDSLRTYRAFNYDKLPLKLNQPKIIYTNKKGKHFLTVIKENESYTWSDGRKGKTIEINKNGDYFVYYEIKNGGNVCSNIISVKNLSQ